MIAPALSTPIRKNLCRLSLAALTLLCAACAQTQAPKQGWFALRWMEKPAINGPSKKAAPEDATSFSQVAAYDAAKDKARFAQIITDIREGDVLAYRMNTQDAVRDVLLGKLNKVGYEIFRYGHLAIVVRDPATPGALKIFSSQSFVGPNVREGLDTLKTHDFDIYRLDKWDRVNRTKMDEFVVKSIEKAGRWYGYDFIGMFGIMNSNMRPTDPSNIGYAYICSTVVVSAFYYSGLELDAIKRDGLLDLVTPAQVIASKGRLIPPPDAEFIIEKSAALENRPPR